MPVSATPNWAAQDNTGGSGPGLVVGINGSNGATATFTRNGTAITVYWCGLGTAGGTFTWTIDGVAQGTINTNGASGQVFSQTVSGLSAGTHTVVLTCAWTSSVSCGIYGVSGRNATGVVLDNYAASSQNSQSYVTTRSGWLPSAEAALWSGGASNPCDLLIYALGVNDAYDGTTPDQYVENVRSYLSLVRDAGGMNGATDLVFLMPHIGSYEAQAGHYIWGDYLVRMRGLAATYGAALIDLWGLYRNSYAYAASLNYFGVLDGTGNPGSDPVHPSNTGMGLIYNAIAQVVS